MTVISGNRMRLTLGRFIIAMIVIVIVALLTTVDVSSEAEPSWIERRLASSLLDVKVRLKAPARRGQSRRHGGNSGPGLHGDNWRLVQRNCRQFHSRL
jgi:hypothetical protein